MSSSCSELVTLENSSQEFFVHSRQFCNREVCPFHKRTEHHMRNWEQYIPNYKDTDLVYRRCSHGTAHPDPDSVIYVPGAPVCGTCQLDCLKGKEIDGVWLTKYIIGFQTQDGKQLVLDLAQQSLNSNFVSLTGVEHLLMGGKIVDIVYRVRFAEENDDNFSFISHSFYTFEIKHPLGILESKLTVSWGEKTRKTSFYYAQKFNKMTTSPSLSEDWYCNE